LTSAQAALECTRRRAAHAPAAGRSAAKNPGGDLSLSDSLAARQAAIRERNFYIERYMAVARGAIFGKMVQ
jgi:hypothetical protein